MNSIIGRITKNAEVNTLANSKQVVNFSVAINDSYKSKKGERIDQTTYYNCSYWMSPNVAKSLTKGTLVELTGRTTSNAWIGKDGEIRSGLNFHTSFIKFHGGGQKYAHSESSVKTIPNQNASLEENYDDLPF